MDIDTSTLSKIERGERKALIKMLKPISIQLNLSLQEVEYIFLKDFIENEFSELEFLKEGLSKISDQL